MADLHIRYNLGKGNIDFRLGGVRPVLSLEAKRRKSKRRDDPELPWEYAGQIFAEMLGQVCYKDFYENPNMEYQEVSSCYTVFDHVWRVGFRNSWKSFINHNLLLQIPQPISLRNLAIRQELILPDELLQDKVKLLRTKKFSFRDTNDRVELFTLLAKLLWYLVSGRIQSRLSVQLPR